MGEDYKYEPAKLYSEETMADIDKRYSELEAEKKKLSVLQPAIKKTEVTKEKEAEPVIPIEKTETAKTKTSVAAPTGSKKDFTNMSDEVLEALLKEE